MKRSIKYALYTLSLLFVGYVGFWTTDVLTSPIYEPTELSHTEIQIERYVSHNELETPMHSFRTDGCTAWPDKLPLHDFRDACLNHDIAYWVGGSPDLKAAADKQLYFDVADSGPLGEEVFAPLMYSALALAGNNSISHLIGSQWGYGNGAPYVRPLFESESF